MAEEPARSPLALIAHAAENGRGIALIAGETKALAELLDQLEDIDRLIADAEAVAHTCGLSLSRSVVSQLKQMKERVSRLG